MKYYRNLHWFVASILLAVSCKGESPSLYTVLGGKIHYAVSIEESKDSQITLTIKITNHDRRSYFVRSAEMPGLMKGALRLSFFTDDATVPSALKYWADGVYFEQDSVTGYEELPSDKDYIARIPLSKEYRKITELRKRDNIYVFWSFKLKFHEDDMYLAILRGRDAGDIKAFESERVGGMLTIKSKK
jgi:hypothetical protein